MSRIGVKPIEIKDGVEINIDDKNYINVKGPKGELSQKIHKNVIVEKEENNIVIKRPTDNKKHKSLHGLYRSLIANMVEGVSKGFEKKLVLNGVGYKADKKGNKLVLNLGYSHPIEMEDPEGINVEVPSQTEVVVKGPDKQKVGDYAARIRELRRPEPYKGKGIKYADEEIRRKEGKTAN